MDKLRLWTVQPEEFFETLGRRGVLRADGRRISEPQDYRAAYRWMMSEMRLRGVGGGKRYPLWFFAGKIDMRETWGPGGVRVARVEVEIPAERALVSDFNMWHLPLNNAYLAATEAEDEAFDAEEERRLGTPFARNIPPQGWWMDPDNEYPPDLRERVLHSWGRIFEDRWHEFTDPSYSGPCYCGAYNDRQAVVEEIYPEDVVRVDSFVTRKTRPGGPR